MLPVVQFDNKGLTRRQLYWQAWYRKNKTRSNAQAKGWYHANKERVKFQGWAGELRRKFGMTVEEYYSRLEKQNHSCAICKTPQASVKKKLRIDHCHKTGKVRGLLCHNCNVTLGLVKENQTVLATMIQYLQGY